MANSFDGAQKYAPELDRLIVAGSKTGFLADNAFRALFTGAKEVKIPTATMVGLGDYDREKGFSAGDVIMSYTGYTLSQERARQLFIDAEDADESGVPDLAGRLMGEYVRAHVIPEVDAYVLSKLYTTASGSSHAVAYDKATAVATLVDTINNVDAACGYERNSSPVAFVDPELYALLISTEGLAAKLDYADFTQGGVDLRVRTLNGCAVIPVGADRMKTAYTYDPGTEPGAGGFTPDGEAKQIHAIVLPRDAASLVEKVNKADLHGLGEDVNRDGYVINFRLYYDVFVKDARKGTVFAIAETA